MADGAAKLSERDYEFQEPTLRREDTVRRENLSGESLGNREEFQSEETKGDEEVRKDFWSIQADFIYRHHIEPRVQLYVPREESFPIPLKYIDVIRSTHTDLDVAQEKRIDDYWNVDGCRNLSDSWTGFTRFILLNETLPKRYIYICGPEGDRQKSKRHHVQIMYGLTLGQELEKTLKDKNNKHGRTRNPNSNMPNN